MRTSEASGHVPTPRRTRGGERPLRSLADQLLEATAGDLSAIEHHPVHVPA